MLPVQNLHKLKCTVKDSGSANSTKGLTAYVHLASWLIGVTLPKMKTKAGSFLGIQLDKIKMLRPLFF